jgi:hypothetical protein
VQDSARLTSRYRGAFYDQVHVNYRQVKSLLITQNNALGTLLGDIVATADNVMYWDMPFQVGFSVKSVQVYFWRSFRRLHVVWCHIFIKTKVCSPLQILLFVHHGVKR